MKPAGFERERTGREETRQRILDPHLTGCGSNCEFRAEEKPRQFAQRGESSLVRRLEKRSDSAADCILRRRRDFQRQKLRNPARCHRIIVSGRTIVTASRTVGASRYSNMKIKRSNDLRAGRLRVRRRSTFNWCRSAITSPSSERLDRKRSRRIHLSRLKISSTRRSSPDSGAQAKRMKFAVGTAIAVTFHSIFTSFAMQSH